MAMPTCELEMWLSEVLWMKIEIPLPSVLYADTIRFYHLY